MASKTVISLLIFFTFIGFMLSEAGHTFDLVMGQDLLTPVMFAVLSAALIAVIALSDVSVLGSSAKGPALALFAGLLYVYFFGISIPTGQNFWYAFIIIPCYIAMGFEFLEVGKS